MAARTAEQADCLTSRSDKGHLQLRHDNPDNL